MKNNIQILSIAILSLFALVACNKETTTIKQYTPPSAPEEFYGTWQIINKDINAKTKEYFIFIKDDNYFYMLSEDENGFKRMSDAAFAPSDKQLNFGEGIYNYIIKNDTMFLTYSKDGNVFSAVKYKGSDINKNTWIKKGVITRTVDAPKGIVYENTIGINDDFLYLYSSIYGGGKVYKYNTLNNKFVDSVSAASVSLFYKNGFTYYGFSISNTLVKTSELLSATASSISTNNLFNVGSLSINGTSNTIYAYEKSSKKLFVGVEGGAFSELYDFVDIGSVKSVVYYGNDEFLIVKDYRLFKVKISPTFKVISSYQLDNIDGNIYSVSTNGIDIWCTAYYNNKYQYYKLNLN